MKKVLKNYKSTIILMVAIIIGVVVGLVFGEEANVLKPFGDLFMNMLFVVIVPLVFLTITTSIAKMKEPKRLSKIVKSIVFVFLITSLVSVIVCLASTYFIPLLDTENSEAIKESLVLDGDILEESEDLDNGVSIEFNEKGRIKTVKTHVYPSYNYVLRFLIDIYQCPLFIRPKQLTKTKKDK